MPFPLAHENTEVDLADRMWHAAGNAFRNHLKDPVNPSAECLSNGNPAEILAMERAMGDWQDHGRRHAAPGFVQS